MKSRLAASFGEAANREWEHPGEEAFRVRGAPVLGRRVALAFLGPLTVLGRLALGPGPIGALGLGRLAMGTEPGPMVPTMPPLP